MDNYLEPLKVESALRSENMKMEYRKANNPNDINILDYTVIESLEKQVPKVAVKGQYSEEYDSYELICPKCNDYVGELENEDGEGIYRYNLSHKYCPECGQRLKVDYS